MQTPAVTEIWLLRSACYKFSVVECCISAMAVSDLIDSSPLELLLTNLRINTSIQGHQAQPILSISAEEDMSAIRKPQTRFIPIHYDSRRKYAFPSDHFFSCLHRSCPAIFEVNDKFLLECGLPPMHNVQYWHVILWNDDSEPELLLQNVMLYFFLPPF